MDWLTALERFGFPTFLVLAIGFAVWRVGQYLGTKLFNGNGIIPQLVKVHTGFVESVNENLGAQTRMLSSIESRLAAIVTAQKAASSEVAARADRNRSAIVDVGSRLETGFVALGAAPDPQFAERMRENEPRKRR